MMNGANGGFGGNTAGARPLTRPVDDATMEEWYRTGFDTTGLRGYPLTHEERNEYGERLSPENC